LKEAEDEAARKAAEDKANEEELARLSELARLKHEAEEAERLK
jgi:hypothetical protein